jgi:hypothetical protein
MCGAHHYHQHEILIKSVNSLFNENKNIYISIEDPDTHLAMFHSCKNLLLHKNGFTVLAAFVFSGNKLYISKKIFNINHDFSKEDGNQMWIDYIKPGNHIFKEIIYV